MNKTDSAYANFRANFLAAVVLCAWLQYSNKGGLCPTDSLNFSTPIFNVVHLFVKLLLVSYRQLINIHVLHERYVIGREQCVR